MFKKFSTILTSVALTLALTGNAMAAFADLELIRVYYDRNGSEIATDLGKVKDIIATPSTTIGGSFGALTTGFVSYFALDRVTNQVWASGSTTTPSAILGGSTGLTGMKNGTFSMYTQLNTQGGTNYTGLASHGSSYKAKLSPQGQQGALGNAITVATRVNTEASLTGVLAGGSVTQALYFWNNGLTTLAEEKIGVAVATITTNANGSTTIGPPPLPVNGACGSANSVPTDIKPASANLCSIGTASTVTGSGPWDWTCNGLFGGSPATCSAPVLQTSTPQSITFGSAPSLTYGGATADVIATATSTLPVTFSSLTTGVCTISGSTVTPVTAGTCTIAADQAGDSTYSAAPQVTQDITVAAAAISITAASASRVYGDPNPSVTGFTPSGLVGTDSIANVTNTIAATATATAAAGSTHAITPSAAVFGSGSADNYAITYVDGALTITQATATVALVNLSQTYDGNAKSATVTTTPAGLATTITYNNSATVPTAAGTYAVVANVSDANYTGSATGSLVISKATPTITWATPAAVFSGSTLDGNQLNATASVPGSLVYNPAAGTVMNTVGNQTLSVAFTPNDAANYNNTTATVTLTVNNKQTPTVTWATPAAISYGTALSATQLNATASVPGSFSFSPASGTLLNAGLQTLSVTFTPTDTVTYAPVTTTVSLLVNKAAATVSLNNLNQTFDGTAKSATATTTPVGLGITVTYNGSATAPTAAGTYSIVATVIDANYSGGSTGSLVIAKATPTITWTTPAAVNPGSTLGSAQLNAAASVPGTFIYTPSAGTVLSTSGDQTLSVAFTPNDAANYNNATASVTLTVNNKLNPAVTWATPIAITYGTALSDTQLNASANVPGSFSYSPASGTLPNAGSQLLTATFTPVDTATYNNSTATVQLTVNQAGATVALGNLNQSYDGATKPVTVNTTPTGLATAITYNGSTTVPTAAGTYPVIATITDANYSGSSTGSLIIAKATPSINWATPAAVFSDSTLGSNQLNATASVPGTFIYTPAAGAVMNASGNQTLSVVFTPDDAANYNNSTASVTLTVNNKQNPTVLWVTPAAITYGTPLSATQLNASASIPGNFSYAPAAGTVFNAGTQTLSATFTPTDSITYAAVTSNVSLTVNKAAATVTLSNLSQAYDGNAKTATATTTPAGLSTTITYNGSATAPTAAGSYTVVASINDANHTGSATGTLNIAKAAATASLVNLSQAYDGSAKSVSAVTTPAGLNTNITYNGSTTAPAAIGTYTIVATINDANYSGSISGTLTINKSSASVDLSNLNQPYDGSAKSVTATTIPAGLTTTITYNGNTTPPTAAGTYIVIATISDANYSGSATGSLTIGKGTATVTWQAPAAITYGTPLSATQLNATSGVPGTYSYTPAAGTVLSAGAHTLAVTFTPDDSTSYASVTSNVSLTVNKAAPAITWKTPAAINDSTPLSATQLNASANIPGSFTYTPAAGAILTTGSQTLSVSFTPSDSANYVSQTASTTLQINPWYPSGSLNGSTPSTISDALTVLQASIGLVTLTPAQLKNVDVAPLVSGKPQPNGKIDLGDALVILQKVIGSVPAW